MTDTNLEAIRLAPRPSQASCADPAAVLLVHIASYADGVACGEVRSVYLMRSYPFHGLDQLLLIMDDMMAAGRYQHGDPLGGGMRFQDLRGEPIQGAQSQASPRERGPFPATLMIRVYFRRHASMQGELRMPGQTAPFRSGIELLRLLHQFLQEKQGK